MTDFENYASQDHNFRDHDQYALAKYQWTLTKPADPRKSISVLNVGCGAGLFNRLLLVLYDDLTAIEPDQNVFNELQTTHKSSVKLINKDILEFETHKHFDVIVMHDVLEHIKEDELAVSKVASLLSPRGVFIGSVPAMRSLIGLHDELIGHYRRSLANHFEPYLVQHLNS
jgi:2-polyprenyl-3-methyl-5-hydroxy-6-metoxy-1,4-benzoquinol methylase